MRFPKNNLITVALVAILVLLLFLILFSTGIIYRYGVSDRSTTLLFVVIFLIIASILIFFKIYRNFREISRINNQLLIKNKIFEHSEQMADISHWYWDVKQNKMVYSKNLYRLLGCDSNDFELTFENFLKFVLPADRHILTGRRDKKHREVEHTASFFRIRRKDGEIRHLKLIENLITDNYGTNYRIGLHADITEQYKKDKIISEKISALERSNRHLSAFSHIASHDLQEPLRKVQTFISRIRGSELKSLPDNVRDYLSGISKETVRMQQFITDLLLYSQASKSDKTFEVTDLNKILDNSVKELSLRIEEKDVKIILKNRLPVVSVIPFQMQQLFSNLISNSIKYSKENFSPVINISAESVYGKEVPDFTGEPENIFHKISFSDNGIGFDQRFAEKIFSLFYRLHSNQEYTGTGIGLAICKIITENHTGSIDAQGFPGIGAVFNVYLPVK
jgi:PAS domain S-box-containing protein